MARKRGQNQKRDSSGKPPQHKQLQKHQVSKNGEGLSNEASSDSRSSSSSKQRLGSQGNKNEQQNDSAINQSETKKSIELQERDFEELIISLYDRGQINSWFAAFLSDCPSGQLDKQQLSDAFTCTYGENKLNHFVSTAFRAFDPTNTGTIGFVSFLTALTLASPSMAEDKLKMIFAYFEQRLGEAIESSRLLKELTSVIQIIYDMVDEDNRSSQRSPKWRVQHILRDIGNVKNVKKNSVLNDLLKCCLMDDVLMEVAAKSIIIV